MAKKIKPVRLHWTDGTHIQNQHEMEVEGDTTPVMGGGGECVTSHEATKTPSSLIASQTKKSWFTLDGRSRRSEYWLKAILMGGFGVGFGCWMCFLGMTGSLVSSGGGCFLILLGVLSILSSFFCEILPVTVRRFHDHDMSGWWMVFFWLFGLIPVVGWIVGVVCFIILVCMDGTPGLNQYGPNPKEMTPCPSAGDSSFKEKTGEPSAASEPSRGLKPEKPTIESRLAMAKHLFERGILTQEEYDRKRTEIIAEI